MQTIKSTDLAESIWSVELILEGLIVGANQKQGHVEVVREPSK